jgi:hypothetical protein
MRAKAKAIHYDAFDRQYAVAARTLLGISGALLSIIGFVLAAGGLLSSVDDSTLYALVGFGLIVAGALIAKRNRAGAWTYTALMAATFGIGLSFAAPPAAGTHFLNADMKGAAQ